MQEPCMITGEAACGDGLLSFHVSQAVEDWIVMNYSRVSKHDISTVAVAVAVGRMPVKY